MSVFAGVALRVASMSVMNIVVLPSYYGVPFAVAVGLLPMIGIFNAIQGSISVVIGYLLYEAYTSRVPTGRSGPPL